jgi:sugar phosphate isomerase/epimerase
MRSLPNLFSPFHLFTLFNPHHEIDTMTHVLTRRDVLTTSAAVLGGRLCGMPDVAQAAASQPSPKPPFRFCLNTSTIRGQGLSLPDEIDIAAKAGYEGIEPWMREIDAYREAGGSIPDLSKHIADAGLTVESAIGFAAWIVDDEAKRREGLEQAKRDMDLLRQIGGTRIAAPPVGATGPANLDLFAAAECYGELLELGRQMGVTPQLELWGFSKSLSRLGEVAFVAVESGHADACLLLDVYHIYKGGSDFAGLRLLSGRAMHAFHVNDYPNDPPRDAIKDEHRVYPGDGTAPLSDILRTLSAIGFRGALSLELFNRDYWQQDALTVAKTGLEKMQAAVAAAFA